MAAKKKSAAAKTVAKKPATKKLSDQIDMNDLTKPQHEAVEEKLKDN